MAGKRCSGRLRFEKDRSRAEAMRLGGATFMELGKAYGISHSLVAKIFKEWGTSRRSNTGTPNRRRGFRHSARERNTALTAGHFATLKPSPANGEPFTASALRRGGKKALPLPSF